MLGAHFAPIAEGLGIAGTVRPAVPDASASFVRDGVAKSPPIMVCVQAEDFGGPVQIAPICERVPGAVDSINVLHRHGPNLRRTHSFATVPDCVDIAAGFNRDDGGKQESKGSVHR